MAAVKFVTATSAVYNALVKNGQADASTLYFVTDLQRIYKGSVAFTGGVYKTVANFPAIGDSDNGPAINTIYVNTTDGSVKFYDGAAYQTIVKPQPTAIGDGSADALATTKAVADYVASKIEEVNDAADALAGRVTAVEKKASANETAIGVINGTGDGSIAKSLQDAKSYTDDAQTALQGEIDKKATKATTLAGYGIGDAYTKSEADSAIATAVANAHHLKREIVEKLPAVAEANADTIYMVGTGEGSETSAYKEYMLVNGKFELIGDSKVDLTDYATKAYADGKANDALAAAEADSLAKIQALDKADTAVTNQYVSAVSETDGIITVSRVTLPVYSVAAGKANGTIAVNGTDVAVTGLGSAAYTDASAYEVAGAADKAQKAAIDKAGELDAAVKTAAAEDATAKANQAKTDAVNTAAADATKKANAAQEAAATDATTKANQALTDAKSYTDTALAWTDLG